MSNNYVKFWNTGESLSKETTAKIKTIQDAVGTDADGYLGEHTLDGLYRRLTQPDECYDDKFFGAYVITGRPQNLCAGKLNGMPIPANSISGVFHDPATGRFASALGYKGKSFYNGSARAWAGKPETFIYVRSGKVYTKRTTWFSESCDFFCSGVGLHNYNPELEGYCRFEHEGKRYNYSDPLRKCWHNGMIVYPDDYIGLVWFYGTAEAFRDWAMDRVCAKWAVMLDGGTYYGGMHGSRYTHRHTHRQHNYIGFKC